MENIAVLSDREKSAKTLTTIIYALYAATFLVGFAAIAGIVMNYLKREDVTGTFLESHFIWQIRTFWFGLLGSVIGAVTTWLYIGWAILLGVAIWVIYRIVKGWLSLNQNQGMAID